MRLPFNLICIDIETTDLNEEIGSIIQLSAVAVDKNFQVIRAREFNEFIKPLDDYRNPSSMSINKITEEQLNTALTLEDALILFESFCEEDKILAAWGAYFDIPFLKKQYAKINRVWPFDYKVLCLKTIATWESSKKNVPLNGGISKFLNIQNKRFEGTQHNAIDDIKNSIKVLQYYLK